MVKRLTAVCLIILGLWGGAVLPAHGADPGDSFSPYIEPHPDGRIDWDGGRIDGVGKGYLHLNGGSRQKAYRAAQMMALQSILKIAAGVRLDDRETLKTIGGGKVAIQLRGLIRYVELERRFVQNVDQPYFEVTRRAPLKGIDGLTARLLDHFQSTQIPWTGFPRPADGAETGDEIETWLVLDARGQDVEPALFPQVLDEAGGVLYEVDDVDHAALTERGMARYVVSDLPPGQLGAGRSRLEDLIERVVFGIASPSPAYAEDKPAGEDGKRRRRRRQYVVKDVKAAEGLTKTNLVISERDARDLKKVNAASKILKKCRVIVVVNSPLGGIEGTLNHRLFAERAPKTP